MKAKWTDANVQKVGIPVYREIIYLIFSIYPVLCQGDIKMKLLNTTKIKDTERCSEGKGHLPVTLVAQCFVPSHM